MQEKVLVLLRAQNTIKGIRNDLQSYKAYTSDSEWEELVTDAKKFADNVDVDLEFEETAIVTSRRQRTARSQTNGKVLGKVLEYYLSNSTTGKRDVSDVTIKLSDRLKRSYFTILDRFISEFDKQFTSNKAMFKSLAAFDYENTVNFLDLKKCQDLSDCYGVHIGEVFSSQVMATKSFIQSLKESKPENGSNHQDLLCLFSQLRELPVSYSKVLKLIQIVLRTILGICVHVGSLCMTRWAY